MKRQTTTAATESSTRRSPARTRPRWARRPASATSAPTSRVAPSRRPRRPGPSSWPMPGPPTSACPTRRPTDELVGDDMDAAEWAALDGELPTEEPAMPADARDAAAAAGRPDETEWEDLEARLAHLEAVQQQVVAAAREREAARVRRKVVASTTGAGAAGFIPLLLQLVDALSLSPQVAATVTTAVAALGALVAGYFTPRARARAPALAAVGLRIGPRRRAAGAVPAGPGAAAPGAPQARRAAPVVRSRLTAGRAAGLAPPSWSARSVKGLQRRCPRRAFPNRRSAVASVDAARGLRARPARRRAERRRGAGRRPRSSRSPAARPARAPSTKASTGSRKSMRSVR